MPMTFQLASTTDSKSLAPTSKEPHLQALPPTINQLLKSPKPPTPNQRGESQKATSTSTLGTNSLSLNNRKLLPSKSCLSRTKTQPTRAEATFLTSSAENREVLLRPWLNPKLKQERTHSTSLTTWTSALLSRCSTSRLSR